MNDHTSSPYSAVADIPLTKSPQLKIPKPITLPYAFTNLPTNIDSYFVTTLDFEEQVLNATEEYKVQKAARDEAKATAMKARDDERLAKQIAAARKIAPGFLDTDQRILTPIRVDSPSTAKDAIKEEGSNTTSAAATTTSMQPTNSNSKVNYDEFDSMMAPPDPWEAPQSLSDMLSSLDENRSSSSPIVAANSQFQSASPRGSIDATRQSQDFALPITYQPAVLRAPSSSPPIPRAQISTSDLASNLASRLLLHNNIPQQLQPPPPPPSLPPKLESGKAPEVHPPTINPSIPSAGPPSTSASPPSAHNPTFPSSPPNTSSTFAPIANQMVPPPSSSSDLNESAIAQLVDIGFERSLAIRALEKKNGKVDAAIEWLLDGNS